LPIYDEDIEGLSKINRQELLNPLDYNNQITANVHQLPYLYHFDIEKHRHPPSKYIESVKAPPPSKNNSIANFASSPC